MSDVKQEIIAFVSKIYIWVVYVALGYLAQICANVLRGKKMTWPQAFASLGIAAFVGYIASVWCYHKSPSIAPYVVPFSTLLSRELVFAVLALKWKQIVYDAFRYMSEKFKP